MLINGGSKKLGIRKDFFSVKTKNLSSFTGSFTGASSSFQFGINSLREDGSKTFPDNICDPISAPFSMTQTEISKSFSLANCFILIDALNPAGPPPTIKTTNSKLINKKNYKNTIFIE